jgi:Predicted membrane protein
MKITLFCVIFVGRYERGNTMEKFKELYLKHKEIANYLIFGVAATIVNWLTYSILVKGLSMDEAVGNAIAVVVAVLFAFVTNKVWVFESKQTDVGSLIKEAFAFFGSRAVTAVIEIIGVPVLQKMGLNQSLFGVKGMWAKIAISVIVIILNYVFSKFIVFRKAKQDEKATIEGQQN